MLTLLAASWMFTAVTIPAATKPALLDQGFRDMYNLNFAGAHHAFTDWEKAYPQDPMGPVSDAAADLFAEFDRLHILQSEFFTDDAGFRRRQRRLAPDAAAKRDFEVALERARSLAAAALARDPTNENALLAALLSAGLHSDYLFLIERRNMAAFAEAKQARQTAQRLLALHPDCYDAYLAAGLENYLLSLKPLPVRWLLRASGGQTDRRTGLDRLRITAEKGRYLRPYARLLLAVAALREKDVPTARRNLGWLAAEFPNNQLYREELLKLR